MVKQVKFGRNHHKRVRDIHLCCFILKRDCVTEGKKQGLLLSVDTHPPLTSDNNEQMLSELAKKYRVPPTRATLAGAAWLTRGAAGTGLVMVMVGFSLALALLMLRHLATWHHAIKSSASSTSLH